MPETTTPGFFTSQTAPAQTFRKFGLRARGWRREQPPDFAYAELSLAARFRNALEELGGLYAAYARFLAWRADLLRTEFLGRLRHVRTDWPTIPRGEVAQILAAELGEPGIELARSLESGPCWNTLSRCAYRARYKDRAVAVQVARDPVSEASLEAFARQVARLDEERIRPATRPEVVEQFHQWIRLAENPARERSYMEALQAVRGRTLVEYPRLVSEISSERVLVLEWVDGEAGPALIARGASEFVDKAAECALEQICTVSAVDADFDPDAMVLTPAGKLALRRADRLVAIPPALVAACLKYVAAVLAGNAPAAAHLLVRLASGRTALHLESRLLDELSNLEPELKVNLQFPPSAGVFEGNWRALRHTGIETPLFLDAMHRNLVTVGYWNAEATAQAQPASDSIAEAQWPVLGRMLRTRVGELLSRDVASDWLIGSGLLFFEGLRQVNRMAEQLRENEMAIGVDLQTADGQEAKRHRSIRDGIIIGMLVVIFLVSLRLTVAAQEAGSGAWLTGFSVLALLTALALFWFVSRFE